MAEAGKGITARRLARMRGTLARRQSGLAVVLENVHDPHNVSAILRSCDAVGAIGAHLVYTVEELPEINSVVSSSAHRWLDVHTHPAIADCYAVLRGGGYRIVATSLRETACELYELDLTRPTALVFGNESRGVSEEAVAGADGTLFIPMMGMVESLNVSVACAVALYEALRQRRAAGMYAAAQLDEASASAQLDAWLVREGRDPSVADVAGAIEPPRARNRYENRPES